MAGGAEQAARNAFRVIAGGEPPHSGSAWLCGHCGKAPRASLPTPLARVCESCFVGVLLQAAADAIRGTAPFIVVDSTLRILAVSEAAEALLKVYEQDATGHHVTEFLVRANIDARGVEHFAVAISAAAASVGPICHVDVRLRQRRAVSARRPLNLARADGVTPGAQPPRQS